MDPKLEAEIAEFKAKAVSMGYTPTCGACAEIWFTGVTTAQHDKSCPGRGTQVEVTYIHSEE